MRLFSLECIMDEILHMQQYHKVQTTLKQCVVCAPGGPPGVDKENVQLSPSSALSSGGRTRHGSASQVQKQRSAGSFKRPSIKKIV